MLQAPAWNQRLTGEVVGPEALSSLASAWNDLCARSVEDNVYYSPRYALALLNGVERHAGVRFALAWEGTKLVGLLPFTRPKLSVAIGAAAGRAWQSKYTFSCMPLLDRGRTDEVAVALLRAMQSVSEGEWIIPTVNTQGAACLAMVEALKRMGQPWLFSNRFQRASLDTQLSFDEHMQTRVSAARRKDLARNRHRLEKLGKVAHEGYQFGEGLDRAVAAFLKIEASGWKGRHGTALGCREDTKQFVIDAFTNVNSNLVCRADLLTLNDEPIAAGLIAFAGRTGFAVKCAYDEAYRHCSVGLLLEMETLRSFLSERWVDRLDAATSGAHILDSLWRSQIEVADLIFSLSRRSAKWRLAAFSRTEHLKKSSRNAIKHLLVRLRSS